MSEFDRSGPGAERLLHLILEQTLAGYWDWRIQEGTEYLSPTFKRMFGYEDHELPNVPETWQKLIFAEDLPGVLETYGRHVSSRGAVPYYNEVRYRHRDGSTVWVICTGTVVEWDAEGKPVRMIGCHVDITARKRAETALRESEDKFSRAFHCAPITMAISEVETGRYFDVNERFEALTGFSRDEAIGRTSVELGLMAAEDRARLLKILVEQGRISDAELGLRRKDGEWVNLLFAGEIITAGGAKRLLSLAVDITEHKRLGAERETTLELLRLLNASNNAHELIRTVTGFLQEWSGCEAVGIRLSEGDDFPYFETRGFPAEFVEAENYLCLRDANQQPLRDGQGSPVLECMCGNILRGRFNPSKPFFTANGSFWTNCTTELLASTTEADRQARTRNRCNGEGYESVALVPLRTGGETLGLLQFNDRRKGRFSPERVALLERSAASIAIALKQRRTAAELRESEARFRAIFEQAGVGVALIDSATGRFQRANRKYCEIAGLTPGHMTATDFMAITHPEDLQTQIEKMDRLRAGEIRSFSLEKRYIRPDASIVWVDLSVSPLWEPGQAPTFHIAVVEDITERKRAEEERIRLEEQLRQAQKLESIGRLAGGVAHDFNNLLTVINGYSNFLAKRVDAESPLRGPLEEIQRAGERAAELVRQLLAFSRKQAMERRVVDLNWVVDDAEKMLVRLLGADIEIVSGAELSPNFVVADPHQLQQALVNLAVNARDAMPNGGRLTIGTAQVEMGERCEQCGAEMKAGTYARLMVADTGAGMDAATRQRVFEPFFTTKEVGKGTGLGLAMVHGIIVQSGGHIDFDSEPGKGSEFRIYLPVAEEEPGTDRTPQAAPPACGSETVLLVEDQPEVRAFVATMLRECGYRVLEASGGKEALDICRTEESAIHLLLTDLVMPKMSGRDLASRAQSQRPGLKTLYMSGFPGAAGTEAPGGAFIRKPFEPVTFLAKVREVLEPPTAYSNPQVSLEGGSDSNAG